MSGGGNDRIHAAAAIGAVLAAAGGVRGLYQALYGGDPDRKTLQAFRNRLSPKRGNPGAEFLGECVRAFPELRNRTLGEFFGID